MTYAFQDPPLCSRTPTGAGTGCERMYTQLDAVTRQMNAILTCLTNCLLVVIFWMIITISVYLYTVSVVHEHVDIRLSFEM